MKRYNQLGFFIILPWHAKWKHCEIEIMFKATIWFWLINRFFNSSITTYQPFCGSTSLLKQRRHLWTTPKFGSWEKNCKPKPNGSKVFRVILCFKFVWTRRRSSTMHYEQNFERLYVWELRKGLSSYFQMILNIKSCQKFHIINLCGSWPACLKLGFSISISILGFK